MALTDPNFNFGGKGNILAPGTSFAAITPHASNDIALTRAVYVGVGGDIVAVGADNTPITFKNVPTGVLLPIRVRRINAVSTTATDMVAIY
jgi:hypothetical protein